MSSRISEITLIVLLLVLAGFTRVYYGGASGPMFVWKSEFGLKDTVVNIADVMKLPPTELLREHSQVVDQLEEMGVVLIARKSTPRRKPAVDHFGSQEPASTAHH
jgi:hypothetical protein